MSVTVTPEQFALVKFEVGEILSVAEQLVPAVASL